jgi:single-strand DNA-binding protein
MVMNKVILMGRLTKDPDIRKTQNNTVARYTLAVDRKVRKDNNDPNAVTADFISCVAWDKRAEFADQYLKKGIKIAIVGHIQTGKYTNKDGQTVYTTDVVIDDQEFCESKAKSEAPAETFVNVPDNLDVPFA